MCIRPKIPAMRGQNYIQPSCRVAYFPFSRNFVISQDIQNLYSSIGHPFNVPPAGDGLRRWTGFVPNYNFYRCCNDPNADGLFHDLICQPFRQARDATEKFIKRIDFLRGDRVAFVTFDRQAFLLNREIEPGVYSHMIDNEDAGAGYTAQLYRCALRTGLLRADYAQR